MVNRHKICLRFRKHVTFKFGKISPEFGKFRSIRLTIMLKLNKIITLVTFRPCAQRVNTTNQYICHRKWPLPLILYIYEQHASCMIALCWFSSKNDHCLSRGVYIRYVLVSVQLWKEFMCIKSRDIIKTAYQPLPFPLHHSPALRLSPGAPFTNMV